MHTRTFEPHIQPAIEPFSGNMKWVASTRVFMRDLGHCAQLQCTPTIPDVMSWELPPISYELGVAANQLLVGSRVVTSMLTSRRP